MKTLIKISSALLLLPLMALAAPQQGPGQIQKVSGNASVVAPNLYMSKGAGMLSFDLNGGKFQAVYTVGDAAVANFDASGLKYGGYHCVCSFTFKTTADGMTTITGTTSAYCSSAPFKKAVCTVDGNASSSSKAPNYSPTLKVDIE
jgi:hypothetical protein